MVRGLSRREWIYALGAGSTVGVAGCNSDGPGASSFAVAIESYDDTVQEGNAMTVAYRVENKGDSEGTTDVQFGVDGTTVETNSGVQLSSGDSTNGSFSYTPGEDDPPDVEITLTAGDSNVSRQVTVEPKPPVEALELRLTDVREPDRGLTSATIPVLFEITNTSEDQALPTPDIEYRALVSDTEIASDSLLVGSLEPGESIVKEFGLLVEYSGVGDAVVSTVKSQSFSVTLTGTVTSKGVSTSFEDTGRL